MRVRILSSSQLRSSFSVKDSFFIAWWPVIDRRLGCTYPFLSHDPLNHGLCMICGWSWLSIGPFQFSCRLKRIWTQVMNAALLLACVKGPISSEYCLLICSFYSTWALCLAVVFASTIIHDHNTSTSCFTWFCITIELMFGGLFISLSVIWGFCLALISSMRLNLVMCLHYLSNDICYSLLNFLWNDLAISWREYEILMLAPTFVI